MCICQVKHFVQAITKVNIIEMHDYNWNLHVRYASTNMSSVCFIIPEIGFEIHTILRKRLWLKGERTLSVIICFKCDVIVSKKLKQTDIRIGTVVCIFCHTRANCIP